MLDKAGGPAPPTAQGALDLSRVSLASFDRSRARLVAAGRSIAGLKPADGPAFLDGAAQENLNSKPFPSGTPIFLLACSGDLNLPDKFAVTGASRAGNRFVIKAEERHFGSWESVPKDYQNKLRGDVAAIPLGALTDGDYEADLIVTQYSFREIEHPEKASQVERDQTRAGKPVGPIRCLFTVGKLSAPRLTRVSQLIPGRANRTFHANGLVDAGHASGSREAPMVHMETTWAPREEIEAIWKAAAALDLEALAKKYPGGKSERSVSLRFALPDGTERDHVFPMGAPELRELEALLRKSGYGAW